MPTLNWVGPGAVSFGICVSTVLVCISVAAFVGAVLFAAGADFVFGSIYPRPSW